MSLSNVIDSKVVELSFENRNFETNAKTSLSTIEKLKKALDFSTTKNGFDYIDEGARKVNINPLTQSVGALKLALNDLGKIAVFSMIADEAIKAKNAVETFVKSVTLDQVTAGWDRYAQKTEAVQTIMAATAKEIEDTEERMGYVNEQLEKLNWFSDETSYSFTDMVSNIGKFTSTGMELNKSVTAMQGISTWAAISGQNTQQASHAMYNLSQALSTGAVKLMDWKSIENANMATAEFKETALQTAEALGTLTKAADGTYKTVDGTEVSIQSFNQTLQKGWFTSDVLMETLDKYGAFATAVSDTMTEMWDTGHDLTTSEFLEYIDAFAEGAMTEKEMAKAAQETGYSVDELREKLTTLSSEEYDLGRRAFKAAQEAKTFGEAIDSVKDAASTGWMNTFELMFGDYLQAKELWTTLANDLYDIFAESGNKRNDLIKEAFAIGENITEADWKKFEESGLASPAYMKAIMAAGKAHGTISEDIEANEENFIQLLKDGQIAITDVEDAWNSFKLGDAFAQDGIANIEKIREEAMKVIRGEYGNDWTETDRLKQMRDAGLDEQTINLTHAYVNTLSKLTGGVWDNINDDILAQADASEEFANCLSDLSDEKLREMGITEEQITAWNESAKTIDDYHKLIEEKPTGGELWTDTLFKSMEVLMNIVTQVQTAMSEVFPAVTAEGLYNFIKGLNDGVNFLAKFTENSVELQGVLQAVFSVFDFAFDIISSAFSELGGVFGPVGEAIFKIADFVSRYVIVVHDAAEETNIIAKVIHFVLSPLHLFAEFLNNLVTQLINFANATNLFNNFKNVVHGNFSKIGREINFISGVFGRFIDHVRSLKVINLETIQDAFKSLGAAFFVLESRYGVVKKVKKAFSDFASTIGGIKLPFSKTNQTISDFLGKFEFSTKFFDDVSARFSNAFEQIANLEGGITFENVQTAIGAFGQALEDTLHDIPVIGYLMDNFDGFKQNVVDTFTNAKTSVENFFTEVKKSKPVKKAVEAVGGAMNKVFGVGSGFLEKAGGRFEAVKEKLMSLDKITFDDVLDAIHGFWNATVATLREIPVVDSIANFFGSIWDGITSVFSGEGEGEGGGFLSNIQDSLLFAIDWIAEKITFAADAVNGFFGSETVQRNIANFKKGFTDLFKSAGPFVDGLVKSFKSFKDKVKEIGGLKIKNIGSIFTALRDTVGSFFSNFTGFDSIKKAFSDLWDSVSAWASEHIPGFEDIKASITGVFEDIKAYFENIKMPEIPELPGLQNILDFITNLFKGDKKVKKAKPIAERIREFVDWVISSFAKIGERQDELIALAQLSIGLIALWKALTLVQTINTVLTGIKDLNKAKTKMFKATAFLEIIAAIGLIVGEIYLLSTQVPLKKLKGTTFVLMEVMGAMALLFVVIAKTTNGQGKDLRKSGLAMLEMAAALGIVVLALLALDRIEPRNLTRNLLLLGGMMVALIFVSKRMASVSSSNLKNSASVLAITASLGAMIGIVKMLDGLEVQHPLKVAVLLLGLTFALKRLIGAIGGDSGKASLGTAATVAAMGLTMLALAGVIKILGGMEIGAALKAIVALFAVTLMLKGLFKSIGSVKPKSATSILAMVAVLGAISLSLVALSGIKTGKLLKATAALSIVMLTLKSFSKTLKASIDENPLAMLPKLLGMAAVLLVVGEVLKSVASIKNADKVLPIAIAISAALLAISGVMLILEAVPMLGALLGPVKIIGFLGALVGVISAIGLISELIPDDIKSKVAEKFKTGLEVIKSIFDTIGEVFGKGGGDKAPKKSFTEGLDELIETVGGSLEKLSSFDIDAGSISKLASSLALVAGVGLGVGLANFITSILPGNNGRTSTETFAAGVTDMVTALNTWITSGITEIKVPTRGIKKLSNALTTVSDAGLHVGWNNFKMKIMSNISGMGDFSSTGQFEQGLTEMVAALKVWIGSEITKIKVPTKGIKKLAGALATVSDAGLHVGWNDFKYRLIAPMSADGPSTSIQGFEEGLKEMASALQAWNGAWGEDGVPSKIDVPGNINGLADGLTTVSTAGLDVGWNNFKYRFISTMSGGHESTVDEFRTGVREMALAIQAWNGAWDETGIPDDIKVPGNIEGLSDALTTVSTAGLDVGWNNFKLNLLAKITGTEQGEGSVEGFKSGVTEMAAALNAWNDAWAEKGGVPDAIEVSSGIQELADALQIVSDAGLAANWNDFNIEVVEPLSDNGGEYVGSGSSTQAFATGISNMIAAIDEWNKAHLGTVSVDADGIQTLCETLESVSLVGYNDQMRRIALEMEGRDENGNLIYGEEGKTPTETFKENVSTLAAALTEWSNTIRTFPNVADMAACEGIINGLITDLGRINGDGLAEKLANWLKGNPDFTTFNERVGELGGALDAFDQALGDLDTEKVSRMAKAARSLSDVATAVDMIERVSDDWTIENELTSFGNGIEALGKALNTAAGSLSDIKTVKQMANSSSKLATAMDTLSTVKLSEGDINNEAMVSAFGARIDDLISKIESLATADYSGVEKFTSSIDAMNNAKLEGGETTVEDVSAGVTDSATASKNAGADLGNQTAAGVAEASVNMETSGAALGDALVSTLSGYNDKFLSIGRGFANNIAMGIAAASSHAKSQMETLAGNAVSALNGYYEKFKGVGLFVAQGFANGMAEDQSIVRTARRLAEAALQEMRNATDEHSPSKEAYKIGHFVVLGFANAMNDGIRMAGDSAKTFGLAAITGMNQAVKNAKDIVEDTFSGGPTITPVLDLSEIQAGSRTIGNMLRINDPIAVTGNVGAINAYVNARDAMASSDDLLDALSALKPAAEGPRNTYVVNGVTYDDGTNIATSVRDLIRYANVERRSN